MKNSLVFLAVEEEALNVSTNNVRVWGSFVLVLAAISLMFYQNYYDKIAVEERAYNHIQGISAQISKSLDLYFGANRQLVDAISDVIESPPVSDHKCTLICEVNLLKIQHRFKNLFLDMELLVLTADGKPVAATVRDMSSKVRLLPDVIKRIQAGEHSVVAIGTDSIGTPAFVLARAYVDNAGELQGILVATEPLTNLLHNVDFSSLGPNGIIAIYDDDLRLLARHPILLDRPLGFQLSENLDESRKAIFLNSFYLLSPLDKVERLMIKRIVPYGVAKGQVTIYIGFAIDDYLEEWRISARINHFLSFVLFATWIYGFFNNRATMRLRHRLSVQAKTIRQIVDATPLPMLLIDEQSGIIKINNRAATDYFGAMTEHGQSVDKLFAVEEFWSNWPRNAGKRDAQVVSRHGLMYFELHCTQLTALDDGGSRDWLLTMVDVSEAHRHTLKLKHEATTDTLTGLANRRYFTEAAADAIDMCMNNRQTLAVLAIDIDHFKRVNDDYGHDVGDFVLQVASKIFEQFLRDRDLLARMGGEEFSALLPGASLKQAQVAAERIRQGLAMTPIRLPDDRMLNVTISIGVAQWERDEEDIQAAIKRSDVALYQAKDEGRNRVVVNEGSRTNGEA